MKCDEKREVIQENLRVRQFEVDHNFIGWRLDEFLANRIDGMSRSLAGRVAREGSVDVEPARKVKAGTRLRLHDRVTLKQELPPEEVQDAEVTVLYADADVLVLNKPAGMLVHETATVRLNTITHYLERAGWEGAEPAHRLDRETSGALVCARRPEVVPALRVLFAGDDPSKVYRALVLDPDGRWPEGEQATVDVPLGLDTTSRLPMRMTRGELTARTHITSLGRQANPFGELADLQVRIETGRQHQIRVHLYLCGTPIAGDKLYGQTDEFFTAICDEPDRPDLNARLPFARHALHAWKISITHPTTKERLFVEAPVPDIWQG